MHSGSKGESREGCFIQITEEGNGSSLNAAMRCGRIPHVQCAPTCEQHCGVLLRQICGSTCGHFQLSGRV